MGDSQTSSQARSWNPQVTQSDKGGREHSSNYRGSFCHLKPSLSSDTGCTETLCKLPFSRLERANWSYTADRSGEGKGRRPQQLTGQHAPRCLPAKAPEEGALRRGLPARLGWAPSACPPGRWRAPRCLTEAASPQGLGVPPCQPSRRKSSFA